MSGSSMCIIDSNTGFDDLFSHDDTVVSKIEIANPLDEVIKAKKYLTCHGCKIEGEYVQIKRNVTVIECSRLGYASSTPSLLHLLTIQTPIYFK